MKAWKRVKPTIVSKIGYRVVVSKMFILPNGQEHHFETTWPEGARFAAVIALTPDNKVIVARQFRPGPEKIFNELPGGFVDDGESPEQAAKRELQEETGYEAGDIKPLGFSHKDAYSNGTFYYFFATNCVPYHAGQQTEDTEHVEVGLVTVGQLLESGRQGLMSDIEALFFADDKLKEIQGRVYA